MERFEDIAMQWQNIKLNSAVTAPVGQNETQGATIHPSENQTIMKSIFNYEKFEKSEKDKQIILASTAIITLFVVGGLNVIVDNIQPTSENYIGFLMLVVALAFSIITNRTDDFPDVRELPMLDYLKAFRENTLQRKRRHIRNSIIAYALFIPAYPMMMYNLDFLPSWVWLIYVILVCIFSFIWWQRKFRAQWEPLLAEIDDRLGQITERGSPS